MDNKQDGGREADYYFFDDDEVTETCPKSELDDPSGYPGYIEFFLDVVETDTIAYKPYKPTLSPINALAVRVPLDKAHVLDYDGKNDECVRITLNGLAAILSTFADTIEAMHEHRQALRRNHKGDY